MWQFGFGFVFGLSYATFENMNYHKKYIREKKENEKYYSFILRKNLQDEYREFTISKEIP